MDDNDLFLVRANDGKPHRWMWNSGWYELAPGEEKILPAGAATGAVTYCTTVTDGVVDSPIEIEPYQGQAVLAAAGAVPVPEAPKLIDPETQQEFESIEQLVEAIKARVGGAKKSA